MVSIITQGFVARQTMLYKAYHNLTAIAFPSYYGLPPPPNYDPHRYDTTALRTSHDLQFTIPHSRIDAYKFSFFPRTCTIWNILPQHIVETLNKDNKPCADLFKSHLQRELTSNRIRLVSPRGVYDRPRLGGSRSGLPVGPVY